MYLNLNIKNIKPIVNRNYIYEPSPNSNKIYHFRIFRIVYATILFVDVTTYTIL